MKIMSRLPCRALPGRRTGLRAARDRVARRWSAEERRIDERRCCRVKEEAVRLRLRDGGHRLRAAAPWMFSTTNVPPMTRVKCGTISRRNTSLPPPGLECVTSATTPPPESFAGAHAIRLATAITTRTRRIRLLTPESLAQSPVPAKPVNFDTRRRESSVQLLMVAVLRLVLAENAAPPVSKGADGARGLSTGAGSESGRTACTLIAFVQVSCPWTRVCGFPIERIVIQPDIQLALFVHIDVLRRSHGVGAGVELHPVLLRRFLLEPKIQPPVDRTHVHLGIVQRDLAFDAIADAAIAFHGLEPIAVSDRPPFHPRI